MNVLVGCETSGTVRDAFAALGWDAWSCDILPADNGGPHHQCDVFEAIANRGPWNMGIFHPTCTFLTVSAAWAFKDPDYKRYPGVGYHQRVKPGTLTGAARRKARDAAVDFARRLYDCGIERVALENPVGNLSTLWRQPDQIVQPHEFGDDASKGTCLWLRNLPRLRPTKHVRPRLVCCGIVLGDDAGKYGCANCEGEKTARPRWGNQTDSGQNRLSPSEDRWKERSKTYAGIAEAMAQQWGR